MQLAQGHHINVDLALVLKLFAFGFTASCSYNCAQDGLDTVQPALVVFLPSTSANTQLTVMVVITHCNLRWWCFPWSAIIIAHLLMCTQTNIRQIFQLALYVCGGLIACILYAWSQTTVCTLTVLGLIY